MKPRIPLAYAGLLIVALVAVVGFAAFSPGSTDDPVSSAAPEVDEAATAPASARVASAVLALRVSDAETRTATTEAPTTTTTEDQSDEPTTTSAPDTTVEVEGLEATTTSDATTTTEAPTTTRAPTTTEAPTTTTTPPADTTPPSLSVTSPDDGDTVDDRLVTFEGSTEPGAAVRSGPFDAVVDDDGSWSLKLVLASGANGAVFTATDDAGNSTDVRLVVYYEPPAPTTTTTTTQPSATTTTSAPTQPKWSPLWPADAGGSRNVEAWRPLVEKYWPADLVACALNIIDLESQGDPRAWNSYTGAEGLFQHLSRYWKGRAAAAGFKDDNGLYATPYNAEANIAAAWVIARNASPWHRPWTVDPFYGDCQP